MAAASVSAASETQFSVRGGDRGGFLVGLSGSPACLAPRRALQLATARRVAGRPGSRAAPGAAPVSWEAAALPASCRAALRSPGLAAGAVQRSPGLGWVHCQACQSQASLVT